MSRLKFLGSKGQLVKPDVYVVDKAVNAKLYADVSDDTVPIPPASIVVLVDGETSEAKLAVKQTPWSEGISLASGGAGGAVAWDDITGKPTVIAAGTTQALARAAIGAGTSNVAIGTTAGTAVDAGANTTAMNLKAPLAAPSFTGIPLAPTAAVGTNTTQVATAAFVLANAGKTKTQIAALVSPATDYADLTAVTAAIKSIIDALKA